MSPLQHWSHTIPCDRVILKLNIIVAAPRAWNRLPTDLKLLRSIASFESKLKSFLFRAAYTGNAVWTLECAIGLIVGSALMLLLLKSDQNWIACIDLVAVRFFPARWYAKCAYAVMRSGVRRVRVLWRNRYWYGHSCYGMLIGNRIQAFD